MPTFDTPEPISVTLELLVGDALITAAERADTVVEVRPTSESSEPDMKAAAQTRVEYSDGRLLVKTPKNWRRFAPTGEDGSVDVRIELPAGSRIQGSAGMAALRSAGRLGDCRLSNAAGDIQLDQTGTLDVKTAAGDVTVDRADGHAEVKTASGAVRISAIDGTAVIKSSSGDTWVGDITGGLRVATASGDISVGHANDGVSVSNASGDIRIGDVTRGTVEAKTANGNVEIGIRDGIAAWLDLDTKFGSIRNHLDATEHPGPAGETVEVRVRTSFGDIVIRRS